MNIHKVLLGAILIKPDLAPYSLPDLEIEHFPVDLQPVFAALSGLWNAKGQLDAVEACARYPEQRTAIMECVEECEGEYIAITRDRIEEWTQLVREQAALTQFQSLALQAGSSITTFADLPGLYSQMGEAMTLDREEQDFKPIGELIDNYIRRLDEKAKYILTGIPVIDRYLNLSPGNLFIIGGRPSAGKTALSLQMACEMARKGYKVCYFSLETDPDTLTARIIANRLAIPLSDVKARTAQAATVHPFRIWQGRGMDQGTGPANESTGCFYRLFTATDRQQGKRPVPANHQHFHCPARTGTDNRHPRGSTGPAEPQCCTRIP